MILVTGATGNIGGELARLLRDDGESVRALVRRAPVDGLDGIDAVEGDLDAPGALDESQVRSTVRDVTGRDPRTFEQWATEHADEFR